MISKCVMQSTDILKYGNDNCQRQETAGERDPSHEASFHSVILDQIKVLCHFKIYTISSISKKVKVKVKNVEICG